MKRKIEIVGKNGTKLKIVATLDAPSLELTSLEMIRWKRKIQNRLHQILRDDGYDASEIRILK